MKTECLFTEGDKRTTVNEWRNENLLHLVKLKLNLSYITFNRSSEKIEENTSTRKAICRYVFGLIHLIQLKLKLKLKVEVKMEKYLNTKKA